MGFDAYAPQNQARTSSNKSVEKSKLRLKTEKHIMAALSTKPQILLRPRKQRAPVSTMQAEAHNPKILGPGGLTKKSKKMGGAHIHCVVQKP